MSEGKRACVIGAGLGGLALAIHLQAAGVATTLIEARDKPGGRAYSWQRDGFTFDAGPTAFADPACLRALWELTGHDMAADVELLPVTPFHRLSWPDGTSFDWSDDAAARRRDIARLDPADVAGYESFLDHVDALVREAGPGRGGVAGAAPGLIRHRAWRSLYDVAARFVRHEKLRQALSFHVLLAGGNPMTAGAIHAAAHTLEMTHGVWCARGGSNRLVAALARHFERLGGQVRLHDPVTRIAPSGPRATGIETRSGWRGPFDAVASNGDLMHTYRDLLRGHRRGETMARRIAGKRFAPSRFAVHFGIEGSWPGIPHRTVLLGPRYRGALDDVFERGVLPADLPIFLDHPTVTDPSLAPEGRSAFCAWVPVAHTGKLAVDWEQVGPLLEQRVLEEVGRRLIPDIDDRIVTRFHYAPRDFALDLNAHLGTAFGPEPTPRQRLWPAARRRDRAIGNLYLVGAGVDPGTGLPGVVAGARATAELMLRNLAR